MDKEQNLSFKWIKIVLILDTNMDNATKIAIYFLHVLFLRMQEWYGELKIQTFTAKKYIGFN